MKFARLQHGEETVVGTMLEGRWFDVTRAWADYNTHVGALNVPLLGDVRDLIERDLCNASFYRRICEFVHQEHRLDALLIPEPVQFQMPLRPGKVIAIGKNYFAHVKEFDGEVPEEPLFFVKTATACIGPEADIVLQDWYGRVDHEGEYGVVIGRRASQIAAEDARDYIAGYTLVNDVTAREIQRADIKKGWPWFRAKNMDTFCPLGPTVVLAETLSWPLEEDLACRVNGEIRQQSNTRMFMFDLPTLIAHVSRHMTLEPGDVIATGTPEGVSPLQHGDVVEVEAREIGVLRNHVR